MFCLKQPTDGGWATEALCDVDATLIDHAHCEMKAASNVLSLAGRYPTDFDLARALTDLAREEIDHFQRVLSMLAARGVALGPPPVDGYAVELRRAAHELPREPFATALVDRLLVGALIEARSCERFKLLVEATEGQAEHTDLNALWGELLVAEARHYRTFVDLAVRASGGDRGRLVARLERLAELEGAIVRELSHGGASRAPRATIHG
jgi:tRNA-(ms[2]io[6]A)-hydroxylase